jgi:hypothetical protein
VWNAKTFVYFDIGCSVPDICENQGFCVSVKTLSGTRAFKCMCYGTGYYGKTCQSSKSTNQYYNYTNKKKHILISWHQIINRN